MTKRRYAELMFGTLTALSILALWMGDIINIALGKNRADYSNESLAWFAFLIFLSFVIAAGSLLHSTRGYWIALFVVILASIPVVFIYLWLTVLMIVYASDWYMKVLLVSPIVLPLITIFLGFRNHFPAIIDGDSNEL